MDNWKTRGYGRKSGMKLDRAGLRCGMDAILGAKYITLPNIVSAVRILIYGKGDFRFGSL